MKGDLGRPPAPAGALGAGSIAGDRLTVHRDAFHVRGGLHRQGGPLTGVKMKKKFQKLL